MGCAVVMGEQEKGQSQRKESIACSLGRAALPGARGRVGSQAPSPPGAYGAPHP